MITLKVLVELRDCLQIVREADITGQRISTKDYLRILSATGVLNYVIDPLLAAQEVEVAA